MKELIDRLNAKQDINKYRARVEHSLLGFLIGKACENCSRVLGFFAHAALADRGLASNRAPPDFPAPMNAAEIQLALQKLNVLGRVLFVAAHPGRRKHNLIALWANGSLYDTAYLSVTRGDGGQNLIGPELGEKLGFIRTHEFLAARRIDHGHQFFTRAVDFGFPKRADETLRIWDRDKILADIVWMIRELQTRCGHDAVQSRGQQDARPSHRLGDSRARSIRSGGRSETFPGTVAFVKVWQPTRLVWNTSPFFYSNRNIIRSGRPNDS